MRSNSILLWLLPAVAVAQQPYYPPAFPPTPVLPSSYTYAPTVTPNVMDPSAPDAQKLCPGYRASNVVESSSGVTADLTLAGSACSVYGNDIEQLSLVVEYQSKERLAVRIFPKHLSAQNQSLYLLSDDLTPLPKSETGGSKDGSDLAFRWTNEPGFQFEVVRKSSNDVLFSTYGSKIVFEDQFLELSTFMIPNYNVYGLAAYMHSFRLGSNYTQTFWNVYNLNNDQVIDSNGHDTHPMYLETRYANGTSASHGVYQRNAHGQDWLLRDQKITYRAIGGSFDLYFLSGSTPKQVISQYHKGIVGTPVLQPYWALGFHQVRWGYQNWTELQSVLDGYAAQGIQVESIMNDLDYLEMNRDFTLNKGHYDLDPGREFLSALHARGQKWLPILNPNIYAPNPANASDSYPPYDRGKALDVYMKNADNQTYYGVSWPGFSAYVDFLAPNAQQFWIDEFKRYYDQVEYDGFWLDLADAVSFCTGSCGNGKLGMNPIHVPFPLPGDPDTGLAVDYRYPEGFQISNATEAASASAAAASQSAAYPTPTTTMEGMVGRVTPTPGVRNQTYPPYNINNFLDSHNLGKVALAADALHADGSSEYELHNLYGHTSGKVTYNALATLYDGKRPWFILRSTFAGSGTFAGHWGGDTNAKWGNMYLGIAEALQFSIAGVPYFGVETCGFNGNSDFELCTRWMQLSAWYPFYRNHNNRNTISQEAYRWASTAESTRRIMNIRYSLLPYTYTLFHKANTAGETVLRALQWEFPDDASLAAVETQFMSGPAILITPVLVPQATTVKGVFPGIAQGTVWYDWYTLQNINAAAGENKTLDAPLLHQPIAIRGGYIVPTQRPGNITSTSRQNPWSLIVALDATGKAEGELYLDDGISLKPAATKNVEFIFENNTLTSKPSGGYQDVNPLSNVTIAGLKSQPKSIIVSSGGKQLSSQSIEMHYESEVLYITGLETATKGGAYNAELVISLSGNTPNGGAPGYGGTGNRPGQWTGGWNVGGWYGGWHSGSGNDHGW
ncbi:Alpha-glucosidase [Pseudocercospora fuligena]|uniref:alpha-glucosidase n=1 Tax=Pseudocercospora fuligena TaxID=685502 RepID=A0A8H6RC02_9PEZI|nr:Alpha-glucosidase [Pseudocercospora fuligena]